MIRSLYFLLLVVYKAQSGILYPRASETREVLTLDGIWEFNEVDSGSTNPRVTPDLTIKLMAVPASYNDIGTDADLRDHAGLVRYQRNFFVPKSWQSQKVWIRFSSVTHTANVWVNDVSAVNHTLGHLPFQTDVTDIVNYGAENTVTVLVDNTLTTTSIPPGGRQTLNSGRIRQTYNFDFFNYAGIDRSVFLYTTPNTYIDDITIKTEIDGDNGLVNYEVVVNGLDDETVRVFIFDKEGHQVGTGTGAQGSSTIIAANFWWPYLTNPDPGYLYTFQVQVQDSTGALIDTYTQKFGIRTITWDSSSLKINNQEVYLRGFGRHEDSDFRGKGLDLPLIVRDHNLILWTGANSYRTSYYPYAEEVMDLVDELGILVTDESPAIGLSVYDNTVLNNHKQALFEMIQRDKNRPSVFLWSAASSSTQNNDASTNYFAEIIDYIKSLDDSRPVTIDFSASVDRAGGLVDIAMVNIYRGWDPDTGDLDILQYNIKNIIDDWRNAHNIPIIVGEYGADSQEGFHIEPTFVWSEDYQVAVLSQYFEVFDDEREANGLIGEYVWNFADFKTPQNFLKLGGNKKGVFSRNRQPKLAARFIRERYWGLGEILNDVTPPADLRRYTVRRASKDEL